MEGALKKSSWHPELWNRSHTLILGCPTLATLDLVDFNSQNPCWLVTSGNESPQVLKLSRLGNPALVIDPLLTSFILSWGPLKFILNAFYWLILAYMVRTTGWMGPTTRWTPICQLSDTKRDIFWKGLTRFFLPSWLHAFRSSKTRI